MIYACVGPTSPSRASTDAKILERRLIHLVKDYRPLCEMSTVGYMQTSARNGELGSIVA